MADGSVTFRRMQPLARKVRGYLALTGESQADLARRAGLNPMTLTHYMVGRRKPKRANLLKLERAMIWPLPDADPTLSPGTNATDYR